MEIEIAYWHWVVFGVVLMLGEIALSTFFILWFGVAAIIVGVVLLAWPTLDVNWQIFIWTVLSVILAILWFKYLKPLSVDRTKAGLSREAVVGEIGHVIQVPHDQRRGVMRFSVPVLGADEWQIMSTDELAEGDRVQVREVSGNTLIVNKFNA